MRIMRPLDLTEEEEEIAMEYMIGRRNRGSHEKHNDRIERNIKILNNYHLFQSTIGTFRVDFEKRINGIKFEYVTRFKIKTRGTF